MTVQRPKNITCPKCGRTSHHPGDIENRYCSACSQFHDDMDSLKLGAVLYDRLFQGYLCRAMVSTDGKGTVRVFVEHQAFVKDYQTEVPRYAWDIVAADADYLRQYWLLCISRMLELNLSLPNQGRSGTPERGRKKMQ